MKNMHTDVRIQYQMISLFQILYLWYQLGLRRNCCPHFLWKREDLGMLCREHVLSFQQWYKTELKSFAMFDVKNYNSCRVPQHHKEVGRIILQQIAPVVFRLKSCIACKYPIHWWATYQIWCLLAYTSMESLTYSQIHVLVYSLGKLWDTQQLGLCGL